MDRHRHGHLDRELTSSGEQRCIAFSLLFCCGRCGSCVIVIMVVVLVVVVVVVVVVVAPVVIVIVEIVIYVVSKNIVILLR